MKGAAAARGLLFGAAPETDLATAPEAYRRLLAAECGLLAPVLPWTAARLPGDYRFGDAATAAIAFARASQMRLTGSHLLWHEWTPDWFRALPPGPEAQRAARRHIVAMATRFGGDVYAWNVVNEALMPDDGRADGLRATALLDKLGPDFIETAFAAARPCDPRALLLYNDYNLEAATRHHAAKRDGLARLLDRLQRAGAPIDGVGLQSHLDAGDPFDERQYRGFLRDIASRGLKIVITELDARDTKTAGTIAARDQAIADLYARFLAVALDERAVTAVVVWGLADPYSWQNEASRREFRRADGLPARPLPYDDAFRPKPAYRAILRALENAPRREPG